MIQCFKCKEEQGVIYIVLNNSLFCINHLGKLVYSLELLDEGRPKDIFQILSEYLNDITRIDTPSYITEDKLHKIKLDTLKKLNANYGPFHEVNKNE